jgi:RecA/RadA recombinase
VKIIIIDSVTFHFRQDFDDMALRTRLLGEMSLKLMKLAKNFSLAVSFISFCLQDMCFFIELIFDSSDMRNLKFVLIAIKFLLYRKAFVRTADSVYCVH